MKRIAKLKMAAAPATVIACLFGAQVAAETSLTAAIGMGPKNSSVIAFNAFADYVAEHSDVKINVFTMSLLSMKETAPGIRDGLADLGFVVPVYYQAEYANTNLAANLTMLSTTGTRVQAPGAAMAGAMTDYIFNCPDCLAEYKAERQVYLGSVSSNPYDLVCTKPIATIEDLEGAKLRSIGGNYSRWAETFGATAVNMPSPDTYEGLSQGVIDCTMASISDLTDNSLYDVATHVTLGVPGGAFAGVATSNFNVDVWADLTTEQREVILRGAAKMQAEMTLGYYELAKRDATEAPSRGVQLVEPSAELLAATDTFVQGDLEVIKKQFSQDYGVTHAADKVEKMAALIEKWKGLTADVADDPEALAQVYWDEIFSKLDPASYGID